MGLLLGHVFENAAGGKVKVHFGGAVELDADRNGAIDEDKGGTNTTSLEELKEKLGIK